MQTIFDVFTPRVHHLIQSSLLLVMLVSAAMQAIAQPPPPCVAPQYSPAPVTITAAPIPFVDVTQFTPAQLTASRAGLNDGTPGKHFLCTFKVPAKPCCTVVSAKLIVRMCANVPCPMPTNAVTSCDDYMELMHAGVASTGMYVYSGTSSPATGPVKVCGANGSGVSRTIVLTPAQVGWLNMAPHEISLDIQDATRVVYAGLQVVYCCDLAIHCRR